MRYVTTTAAVLAGLVALYWGLLFIGQRRIVFPAPPLADAPARPRDAQAIWLETPTGSVEAWYLRPLVATLGPAPLLVFTHGNAELIDYWPQEFHRPRQWGMAVLLVEYPGYGRSHGQPTQASVTAAVLAAYDWSRGQADIDTARVIAYGRSLGGAAATALAGARPIAALILESTFTRAQDFARQFGAPGLLVRDRFDNLEGVHRLKVPLLILHGTRDRIVPVAHAHALHAAQPVSELVLMPCGHNDCPRPWSSIEHFLRAHALLRAGGSMGAAPSN
jgi:pimeloyl-ACP methyl ester carboxylesterase